MRRGVLILSLLLSLAPAAWAQEGAPASISRQEYAEQSARHLLMALGGHIAGGSGALLSGVLVEKATGASDAGLLVGLALYPLGVAAASYGIGRGIGPNGTFVGTLGGAYLGAGIGAAVGAGALLVLAPSADSVEDAVGAVLLGGALYVVGTLAGAVRGYHASIHPTALHTVDGRMILGAQLTVSL